MFWVYELFTFHGYNKFYRNEQKYCSVIQVCCRSVETGKCLDNRVLTKKKYAQCSSWDNRKYSNEYNELLITHESGCLIIHIGSAGKLECDGIVACFESSVEPRKLQYTEYLDGDSVLCACRSEKPLPGHPVNKLECVGHIQKRVGSRCRKMKQGGIFRNIYSDEADPKTKRKKLLRLTDKDINKLQNEFGIAIRDSKANTVYEMKKAIAAVLYHCSESETVEKRHQFCRVSEST